MRMYYRHWQIKSDEYDNGNNAHSPKTEKEREKKKLKILGLNPILN